MGLETLQHCLKFPTAFRGRSSSHDVCCVQHSFRSRTNTGPLASGLCGVDAQEAVVRVVGLSELRQECGLYKPVYIIMDNVLELHML